VAASLWYTQLLVQDIAREERNNIQIWADAIHQKAALVNYTDEFFKQLQDEERKKAEQLADAFRIVSVSDESDVLNFFLKIIKDNTTIPVILTDSRGKIKLTDNVSFDPDTVEFLRGQLRTEFMVYEPVKIAIEGNQFDYLFYKESILFNELRQVLDDLIDSFFSEIVINSASVPVIITDSSKQLVIEHGKLDPRRVQDSLYIIQKLHEMADDNDPIEIELADQGKRYIYYQDSELLTRLMFFPYFQLGVIGVFLFVAYILFSSARNSEQKQVWVGLAKETAHQLGTPLSSMIGWIELLKMDGIQGEAIQELNKDVERLQKITDRFSKIGSEPILRNENMVAVAHEAVNYIKSRSSRKMNYKVLQPKNKEVIAPINLHLFEWVIENILKNAIDATGGDGNIEIDVTEEENLVLIDISDDGKGIPKSLFKAIFSPGFTSKKRGWGLGLSLAKRIIKDYHKGKIFVKQSTLNKGSTIRIILRKQKR
jgi:signal transduction histidine kinase